MCASRKKPSVVLGTFSVAASCAVSAGTVAVERTRRSGWKETDSRKTGLYAVSSRAPFGGRYLRFALLFVPDETDPGMACTGVMLFQETVHAHVAIEDDDPRRRVERLYREGVFYRLLRSRPCCSKGAPRCAIPRIESLPLLSILMRLFHLWPALSPTPAGSRPFCLLRKGIPGASVHRRL